MPLPDLIVGGAPRSGTTFLYDVLAKHPDVYVNRPSVPEPKVCLVPAHLDDDGRRARYAELYGVAPAGALRVEKTSNYFENDAARIRLARILPDAKFVFILREPVARAYSNWMWSTRNGLEDLPFAEAIAQAGRRPDPLPPEKAHARPHDYLERGRYGTLAARWIDTFGADRILFLVFERAVADPERLARDLQGFAGLKPLPWERLAIGRVNATSPMPPDFDPGLVAALRRRFEPEIDAFAALTGTDISPWRS